MVQDYSIQGGREAHKNPMAVFRQTLERDGISMWTAQFRDKKLERKYVEGLVETTLPNERSLWWGVILTYFSYGILDVLTIGANLDFVLALRVICGSAMLGIAFLSFVPRLKPHYPWLTSLSLWLSAVSVIWMIYVIPPVGAPPYIIGILVIFIASSCIMRIPFRLAAAVYLSTTVIYLAMLNLTPSFSDVDVIAGHFFMLSITAVAIVTNYTQEIRSRMIWLRDEQRKRDAEMIEKLLIEATAADQSKINFLSMMSHELRTPLHQIIGYAEVVSNSCKAANDMDDNVRHLSEIHGSAHVLLSRIQKMLRFVDATAGKMKYEIVDTPVSELIDVALERMRAGLDKKSIYVDTTGLEEAVLNIDIVHTCYAVNNLIENAVNASPEGSTLWVSGGETPDKGYELVIRDEGSGMSGEQIARAFKPFIQGETALVRSREGLGLGLTLAKHIFEDQNATITLISDGVKGTIVKVHFAPSITAEKDKPANHKAAG